MEDHCDGEHTMGPTVGLSDHPEAMQEEGEYMDYRRSILTEAERVFGDKQKAAVWMSQPRSVFGNRSALELACDRAGSQKVREELTRLKHGFAS